MRQPGLNPPPSRDDLRWRQSFERRADLLLALLVALFTLRVYLATIYPGLIGSGDAAKFAFIGKVLGTPHPPGYPLYVMVSHLFSYVPWGTLAHRMNVLSALLASIAVAVTYLTVRALGTGRAVAVSTALALGFGRAFWSKALYPKAYTLTAALVTAGVLMLVRWSQTRRCAHLYWAIAIFALSIGNHLVVISLLPALALYALMTDARTALAPRTIVVTAALLILGLSQYALILVRTWQHAPYLEAAAWNVRELIDVVTARHFSQEIGAFTLGEVFETRIPAVAALVSRELGGVGLFLAGAGLLASLRRHTREATLCVAGALGVMALTANMSSDEDEGFLLAAFALLWLLTGAGLEWITAMLRRTSARWSSRSARLTAAAVGLVLAVTLPAGQVAANYRANDHHRRTFEIRYFTSLFEMLPDKSAILLDEYSINMMVFYKLLGERAAADRDVIVVPQRSLNAIHELRRRGYRIFGFDQARRDLRTLGLRFEPIQLLDVPLPDYLALVRENWIVAVAATPGAALGLRSNPDAWKRLGASGDGFFGRVRTPYGLIGVQAAEGFALEATGSDDVDLIVEAGKPIARTGARAPVSIRVEADYGQALVTVNGIDRARATTGGAILAIINPRGGVEAHVLDPQQLLRVPFDMRLLPLFRLVDSGSCDDASRGAPGRRRCGGGRP